MHFHTHQQWSGPSVRKGNCRGQIPGIRKATPDRLLDGTRLIVRCRATAGRPQKIATAVRLAAGHENLYPEFRQAALDFYKSRQIKWHDGQAGQPSNHLCDSQVCCVNSLFPFSQDGKALCALLRPIFPTIMEVLPFDGGAYLIFEWIGERDYLGEKTQARNKTRSRGANGTSSDAAGVFAHADSRRQRVLIERKYCEACYAMPLHTGPSGARRRRIYPPMARGGG